MYKDNLVFVSQLKVMNDASVMSHGTFFLIRVEYKRNKYCIYINFILNINYLF